MGTKISVDKHVSNLEDILELNPAQFKKLKFESSIPDHITQHLKLWKFYRDESKGKGVQTAPISLNNTQAQNFTFSATECYIVLLIYKKSASLDQSSFVSFPHSLYGLIESYTTLTPRGLAAPVSSSETPENEKQILEGFLLPKRPELQPDSKLEYMIFVWNGKNASPFLKSMALSTAFELESLFNKGQDALLQVLFAGGIIRDKKLQKGTVLQLNTSTTAKTMGSEHLTQELRAIKETVYLLKFLFPSEKPEEQQPAIPAKPLFSTFKQFFLESKVNNPMENYHEIKSKKTAVEVKPYAAEAAKSKQAVPQLHVSVISKNVEPQEKQGQTQRNAVPSLGQGIGAIGHPKIPNLNLPRAPAGQQEQVITTSVIDLPEDSDEQRPSDRPSDRSSERISSSEENRYSDRDTGPQSDRKSQGTDPNSENLERRGVGGLNLKPSIGTLQLGTKQMENREENLDKITPERVLEEENGEIDFDMRDTNRKVKKIEYYSKMCSEVLPEGLYVGGEYVAHNLELMKSNKITHIINCAADVLINKFPKDFTYKTYFLKDSKTENIECCFYDSIAFIENAIKNGGRVLVHCVQGVSRSASICISYLIYKYKYTYEEAFNKVKKARGVTSPNMGFTVQLLLFYKRLYEPMENIPGPRVFCISSHQKEQPEYIVARYFIEPLYSKRNFQSLDPRGVFLIQTKNRFVIWMGQECPPSNKEIYIRTAENYIKTLQQYEKGSSDVEYIDQGHETPEFWKNWGLKEEEQFVRHAANPEWTNWFLNLGTLKKEDLQGKRQQAVEEDPDASKMKPKLYIFPDWEKPVGVFDYDEEFTTEVLACICTSRDDQNKVFVWRGDECPVDEDKEQDFVRAAVRHYWKSEDPPEGIQYFQENPREESEEFMAFCN